ncbi:MAG: ATP-binding protein [Ichthyobacteriaceae bacterium]|nr:ATP-binding protein [Ichthyobacteriaceae bacterium]
MEKEFKQTKRTVTKVVILGAESSGKSTLAKLLATNYNTVWVDEFLREFATQVYANNKELVYTDNIKIIEGQLNLEKKQIKKANKIMFCDTDAIQTLIYSDLYYAKHQPEIINYINNNKAHLYLLLYPDVAWEPDPLRDKPNQRLKVFQNLENKLIDFNVNYKIINGSLNSRLSKSIKAISTYIK